MGALGYRLVKALRMRLLLMGGVGRGSLPRRKEMLERGKFLDLRGRVGSGLFEEINVFDLIEDVLASI